MYAASRIINEMTAITTGAGSASTAPFGEQTRQIRVAVIGNACYIAIGETPTATSNSPMLPVNTVDYFTVTPGQKLAALQNTGAGTLSITEMG
jgi:hypothetical protein